MLSYEHKKIVERIIALDTPPSNEVDFLVWIKAGEHLAFLESNANSNEIIVYASGEYSFVHSMAVPESLLDPLDKDDLLRWSTNPYTSAASYVSGGGKEGLWVEHGEHYTGSEILNQGTQLIYGRTFEGWSGEDSTYYEISQENSHHRTT